MLALADVQQSGEGVGLDQRHIARQDQGHTIVSQDWHGLLHGVSGAQLRHLAHALQMGLALQ